MEDTVIQKFLEGCCKAQTIGELLALSVPVWRELNQDLRERGVSQEHRNLFFKMKRDGYYHFKEENKLDEPLSEVMKLWIEDEVAEADCWDNLELAKRIVAVKLMVYPSQVYDNNFYISPEIAAAFFDIEHPGLTPTPELIPMWQASHSPYLAGVDYLGMYEIPYPWEMRKKR